MIIGGMRPWLVALAVVAIAVVAHAQAKRPRALDAESSQHGNLAIERKVDRLSDRVEGLERDVARVQLEKDELEARLKKAERRIAELELAELRR